MMLVLTRKIEEEIVLGGNIRVRVISLRGNTVRIGIEAPEDVRILRGELASDLSARSDVQDMSTRLSAMPANCRYAS